MNTALPMSGTTLLVLCAVIVVCIFVMGLLSKNEPAARIPLQKMDYEMLENRIIWKAASLDEYDKQRVTVVCSRSDATMTQVVWPSSETKTDYADFLGKHRQEYVSLLKDCQLLDENNQGEAMLVSAMAEKLREFHKNCVPAVHVGRMGSAARMFG